MELDKEIYRIYKINAYPKDKLLFSIKLDRNIIYIYIYVYHANKLKIRDTIFYLKYLPITYSLVASSLVFQVRLSGFDSVLLIIMGEKNLLFNLTV